MGEGHWKAKVSKRERTASIAFLTRSDLMRPDSARLVMRAVLVVPEQRQAMVREG